MPAVKLAVSTSGYRGPSIISHFTIPFVLEYTECNTVISMACFGFAVSGL
ncbi:uncharacterized protein RAG0_05400 [Rhynchosporium agropyri]|uniref:Uncharacterized protein n=2 Tax=Rhynchosporium TaxID=38037 RepID=A0A1E1LVB3_RHYSE|nr:uncharacterized protein RAG0_05400 [Rhynchosporium agropyri]CZT40770.1 uncharacterized protein RSE6_00421 [Rhynchosporium secalis]